MLQDVAFGNKMIKLDSGENIVIPAVVRTIIASRIIEQYRIYCAQTGFESVRDRSLYRMIEVCAASAQKSLQGLDDTTTEGTEAIDDMEETVRTLNRHGSEDSWVKHTQQRLKEAKRHLETEFKGHVGREESCADHCTTHALSDPNDKYFQSRCPHDHDVHCRSCQSLTLERLRGGGGVKWTPP